jgi:hypothetical protein
VSIELTKQPNATQTTVGETSFYGWLYGVDFADSRRAVAVGSDGVILASNDEGLTWTQRDFATLRPTSTSTETDRRNLRDVTMLANGAGWAVGERGWIVETWDYGETWDEKSSPTTETLLRIGFRDDQNGFIVGHNGTVLTTTNGGRNWNTSEFKVNDQTIKTAIAAVTFTDSLHGYLAGQDETLLRTSDGGATWEPVRQYERRLPPISKWGFVVAILILPLSLFLPGPESAPPDPSDTSEPEMLENFGRCLSDRPIGEDGQGDTLNFAPIAEGLGRYLYHGKTEPPLSMSIDGEWGTGKSSMMKMLAGEVERKQRQVVWFNAWHFQNEENLLAALLEAIRNHAMPHIMSAQGVRFRIRLLKRRMRRRPVFSSSVLFAWTTALAYLTWNHFGWWNGVGQEISHLLTMDVVHSLTPDHFEVIQGLIGIGGGGTLYSIFRGLRAFGVSPGQIAAAAKNEKEARRQVMFREEFQREFKEVSEALKPGGMVIFVDDLDRCRPENVMTVLQAVNFLVSSGDCFIVFGMDTTRVQESVALARSRELAEASGNHVVAEDPRQFALDYLEKLVQIRVQIPRADDAGTWNFITGVTQSADEDDNAIATERDGDTKQAGILDRLRKTDPRTVRYLGVAAIVATAIAIAPLLPVHSGPKQETDAPEKKWLTVELPSTATIPFADTGTELSVSISDEPQPLRNAPANSAGGPSIQIDLSDGTEIARLVKELGISVITRSKEDSRSASKGNGNPTNSASQEPSIDENSDETVPRELPQDPKSKLAIPPAPEPSAPQETWWWLVGFGAFLSATGLAFSRIRNISLPPSKKTRKNFGSPWENGSLS